jgi:hypothetical protein
MEVNNIIDGLLIEVTKLEREMVDLKNKVDELKRKTDATE